MSYCQMHNTSENKLKSYDRIVPLHYSVSFAVDKLAACSML